MSGKKRNKSIRFIEERKPVTKETMEIALEKESEKQETMIKVTKA